MPPQEENNTMKIIPEFYKSFACLASDCPDTCCKDWDIVIDDNTLDFYRTVPEIAKRVKTDKDGDKIISFENGICPFLTQKGLCNIQQKHGAEKLCETCRSFPRITEDYTLFEEHMLTLACPEAARLMIISHDRFSFMENSIAGSCDEYDSKMMSFLLRSRFPYMNHSSPSDSDGSPSKCLSYTQCNCRHSK